MLIVSPLNPLPHSTPVLFWSKSQALYSFIQKYLSIYCTYELRYDSLKPFGGETLASVLIEKLKFWVKTARGNYLSFPNHMELSKMIIKNCCFNTHFLVIFESNVRSACKNHLSTTKTCMAHPVEWGFHQCLYLW